jgi:2-oxoglutarate dehydrogenase E2 component (dihydrolipoamide succinyltransferase)
MTVEIKVPSIGESITEGIITRWLKHDGDFVREGETVFELDTEKATTEVPSPAAGLLHIGVPSGKTVAIGSTVGTIDESAHAPKRPEKAKAEPPTERPATSPEPQAVSPAARRLIAEAGLGASTIPATGRGGLLTKADVLRHLDEQSANQNKMPVEPAPIADTGRISRQPMSVIRQRIAERLVNSQQTTATLTTFNEADMSAILALRAHFKEHFKEKHGIALGFMSFFVKACVVALREYPIVNAFIEGRDIVYHDEQHIGVAVSTERGLMVPVVRDAGKLTFAQIEKTISELAEKARSGKIAVSDLQHATFTITNGGVFGSLLSTPILNPPQSAILGMHAIQKRPVAVEDRVEIRPMMYLALSYDHRLIDGREAVLFLVRVKECIEKPERMLLEI